MPWSHDKLCAAVNLKVISLMVAESCVFAKEQVSLSMLSTAAVNSLSHAAAADTKPYIFNNFNIFNIYLNILQ